MTRFRWYLLGVLAMSLGLRVGYVLAVTHDDSLAGDQFYYAAIADSIAGGHGFREPFVDATVPSADHPPLTSVVMVPASLLARGLGIGSTTPQRLTMSLVGTLTVLLIALAGREVMEPRHLVDKRLNEEGGDDDDADGDGDDAAVDGAADGVRLTDAERAGLGAAAMAALSAGLWINDAIVMAESVTAACLALVILVSIKAWDRPDRRTLAWLGAAIGLAALARAESLLLLGLLVPALAWRSTRAASPAASRAASRSASPAASPAPNRRRVRTAAFCAASATGACLAVLAPWVIPNLVRFEQPVALSTNDGLTLLGANCPDTYAGPGTGFWSLACTRLVGPDGGSDGGSDGAASVDDSVMSDRYRTEALHQIRSHLGALPRVVAVRELRTFGVWDVRFMNGTGVSEGRPVAASWLAWVSWWITAVVGGIGLLVLGRRHRPWWLLAVHVASTVIVTAVFYGLYRFRLGAEVGLLVAAGPALAAATARWPRPPRLRTL